MNNNTKARDQIRNIPGDNAEIVLYRNQRSTVLLQDIYDLNNAANELIDPATKSNSLSLAAIKDKLAKDKMYLQSYEMPEILEPADLYTEGSDLLLPTQPYWGIKTIKPSTKVKLSEKYTTDLTYDNLTTVEVTDTDGNVTVVKQLALTKNLLTDNGQTFGVDEAAITPKLVVKNIDKSINITSTNTDLVIDNNITTYNYNDQLSFQIDPTTELGITQATGNIEIHTKTKKFTAAELIAKRNTIAVPDNTDIIGFDSIEIPDFISIDLEQPTIQNNYFITDNTAINVSSDNENAEKVDGTTDNIELDLDISSLGYNSINNVPTKIGSYNVRLAEPLALNDIGTYNLTNDSLLDDTNIIGNLEASNIINSIDTQYALSALEIPKTNSCTVELSATALKNCMANGAGTLLFYTDDADKDLYPDSQSYKLNGLIKNLVVHYPEIVEPKFDIILVTKSADSPEFISASSDIENILTVNKISETSTLDIYNFKNINNQEVWWLLAEPGNNIKTCELSIYKYVKDDNNNYIQNQEVVETVQIDIENLSSENINNATIFGKFNFKTSSLAIVSYYENTFKVLNKASRPIAFTSVNSPYIEAKCIITPIN